MQICAALMRFYGGSLDRWLDTLVVDAHDLLKERVRLAAWERLHSMPIQSQEQLDTAIRESGYESKPRGLFIPAAAFATGHIKVTNAPKGSADE